jgi:hypothetical protein
VDANELARVITGALNAYQQAQTTTVDIQAQYQPNSDNNFLMVEADGGTKRFLVQVIDATGLPSGHGV